jgi:hypothetical protein
MISTGARLQKADARRASPSTIESDASVNVKKSIQHSAVSIQPEEVSEQTMLD